MGKRQMARFKLNITGKILLILLSLSLIALIIFTTLALNNMTRLGGYALEANKLLGARAVGDSTEALKKQAEEQLLMLAVNQAAISNALFERVESEVETVSNYAASVWANPANFTPRKTYFQTDKPPDVFATSVALTAPGVAIASIGEDLRMCSSLDSIFIPISQNDPNIMQIYMGTESGIAQLYPWATGIPATFDPRLREWYVRAREEKSLGWTNVMVDAVGGKLMVTCSRPVFDAKRRFIGVIGADVTIDTINQKIINSQVGRKGYAFLVDGDGHVIARPGLQAGDMRWDESYRSENLLQSGNQDLVRIVKEMITINTGISRCKFEDGEKYIAYAPVMRPGWSIGIVMPLEEIIAPAMETQSRIASVTEAFMEQTDRQIQEMQLILILTSAGIIILVTGVAYILSRRITRPILALDSGARLIGRGNLDHRLDISTGDEIQDLADTFNSMAHDLKSYIADLQQTTQTKERIESELRVATEIQSSMLPRIFPPFPERKEFDLYAIMHPAREVGGDFYDFFFVADNKLCLVVGDVCGKGIPAALFMAISKTLIKTEALLGFTADQVLSRVNDIIYPDNETSMFFTGICAFLDTENGGLSVGNGGHNLPLLSSAGGDFKLVQLPRGLVVGAMPHISYETQAINLAPGDTLFLYTDGVTEAMNGQGELYGTDRLTRCLDRLNGNSVYDLIHGVKADIEAHAQGTPQSDDITMLALRYNGNVKSG
jgi:sigma-B regulation protein RsbU (phosphoserine phosphatase)